MHTGGWAGGAVINMEIVSAPSHRETEKLNYPLAVRHATRAFSVPGPVLTGDGGTEVSDTRPRPVGDTGPACDKTPMFLHVADSLSEGQRDGEADGA